MRGSHFRMPAEVDTLESCQYPAPHMEPRDEMVTIVDRNNAVIGARPRHRMRAQSLIHRATYVLVFDRHGAVYVQKRTIIKDVFPGYFDTAAGGVVLAGEDYMEGALREIEEELGIRGVLLTPLFRFYHEDRRNKVWGAAFFCTYDGPIVVQPEEVESGGFAPPADVLKRSHTEPFTPDGCYVLRRYVTEFLPSETKRREG